MTLTQREVQDLRDKLRQIRGQSDNPAFRRNRLKNLCDKATLLLNKAERRAMKPVTLKFEAGDFDL